MRLHEAMSAAALVARTAGTAAALGGESHAAGERDDSERCADRSGPIVAE
jgi:hypothetical protein